MHPSYQNHHLQLICSVASVNYANLVNRIPNHGKYPLVVVSLVSAFRVSNRRIKSIGHAPGCMSEVFSQIM
jgi:hypothetical protein